MDKCLLKAWCSGFLEGDGTFDARHRWRAISTEVSHVERLVSVFGGKYYANNNHIGHDNWNQQFEWCLSTKRHGPLVEEILPGLSDARRQSLTTYGFQMPVVENQYSEDEWWAWLAGFTDAEGHVCGTGHSLSTNFILVQVASDETLRNAQRITGSGSINWHPNKWRGSYRYGVYGAKADAALVRLMPYLCAPRQNQIRRHWAAQVERRSARVVRQPRTPEAQHSR